MIKYGLIRRNKLRYKLSKNAREIKLGEVLLVSRKFMFGRLYCS